MRRKEKEITGIQEIEKIISKSKVCHLGLAENNIPYVVPVCFGYVSKIIYFHSAKEGRKIDIIKNNNKICFEFCIDPELIKADKPCKWGMKYKSVIGSGKTEIIEDIKEKQKALSIIMQNHTVESFNFPASNLKNTLVVKIDIEQISGKESGY